MREKNTFIKLASSLSLVLSLGLVLLLTVCQPNWEIRVNDGSGAQQIVQASSWQEWQEFLVDDSGRQAIPLERVFAELGYSLIENIKLTEVDGLSHDYDWAIAAPDSWLLKDGQINILENTYSVSSIQVEPPLSYFQVSASILDIAPTVAYAMGFSPPSQSIGVSLLDQPADRVMLVFLDGFGYLRYLRALDEGLIPFLGSLDPPLMALATYPPVTRVSTASVLTGAPPQVHGVNGRDTRKTEIETLFDVAVQNGISVGAIEGESLAFELRNATFKLSGDRNGDGNTDDEVLVNALDMLKTGQPDLFWVHFHGIDDAGHTYGPGWPDEQDAVRRVDAAVGELVQATLPGVLVIIFADHGMHQLGDEGQGGNHGYLIEEDIFNPNFHLLSLAWSQLGNSSKNKNKERRKR